MEKNYQHCLEMILHHKTWLCKPSRNNRVVLFSIITNLGVTKRVYEEWVGTKVTEDKMKNLKVEDVPPIYKKNYWFRVKGNQLPSGLDLCVFDFGVNT